MSHPVWAVIDTVETAGVLSCVSWKLLTVDAVNSFQCQLCLSLQGGVAACVTGVIDAGALSCIS